MHAAEMHHDLGLDERPDDDEFDDFILHVDGWLCEIKDAQIRDGLHVLGQAPAGEARVNLVLAILRASPGVGRRVSAVPGLRAALGSQGGRRGHRRRRRDRGAGPRAGAAAWRTPTGRRGRGRSLHDDPRSSEVLQFAATEVVPRLARTSDELDAVLHALDGGFIPAGPSGSPLRGLVNVLPTGRNFYSVDPKAVPSRLAWETGQRDGRLAAAALPRRHRRLPASRSGCRSGAPARCAPPATTSPRCSPCSACGRRGTRRRAGSST